MSTLAEATTTERFWRCQNCGHEAPLGTFDNSDTKPQYDRALTHACNDGCVGHMRIVERERVYASAAERAILENFEVSDWGLLAQAAKHYAENRKRTTRGRNPGAWNVMQPVFKRLDALARACERMRREAPADTDDGGRIAKEF